MSKSGVSPASKCKLFQNYRSTSRKSTPGKSNIAEQQKHYNTAYSLFQAKMSSPDQQQPEQKQPEQQQPEQPTPDSESIVMPELLNPEVAEDIEADEGAASKAEDDENDLIFLTGGVEFSLKLHRMHPQRNILWEVFGKLINSTKCKETNEVTLELQSLQGEQILKATFCRSKGNPTRFSKDDILRLVGRYVEDEHFNVHRLDPMSSLEPILEYLEERQNFLSPLFLQENEST